MDFYEGLRSFNHRGHREKILSFFIQGLTTEGDEDNEFGVRGGFLFLKY